MDDLDMEFDIEDDPIKKFLLSKLEEIKITNSDLENQRKHRIETISTCISEMTSKFGENILEVDKIWQRIVNDKWVIGIDVKKTSTVRSVKNLNVILSWDSVTPIYYDIKIFTRYKPPEEEPILPEKLRKIAESLATKLIKPERHLENEWIPVEEISHDSTVVVSLKVPEFLDKRSYNISGAVFYEHWRRKCQISLPDFQIKADDTTSTSNLIKKHDLLSSKDEEFLAVVASREVSRLIAVFSGKLDALLEFECTLKRISVKFGMKCFFYADSVSDVINGAVLELEDNDADGVYNLSVYYSNRNQLIGLLHFLHRNIPGVIILPRSLQSNLNQQEQPEETSTQSTFKTENTALTATLQKFTNVLENQMSFMDDFYTEALSKLPADAIGTGDTINLTVDTEDYKQFRRELAKLESKTDTWRKKFDKFVKPIPEVSSEEFDEFL